MKRSRTWVPEREWQPQPFAGTLPHMIGAIIIAVVLVVVIPVGFLMTMALPAGVLGFLLKSRAEAIHPDSELIDTNY